LGEQARGSALTEVKPISCMGQGGKHGLMSKTHTLLVGSFVYYPHEGVSLGDDVGKDDKDSGPLTEEWKERRIVGFNTQKWVVSRKKTRV